MNQTLFFRFGERTAVEQSRMDETACTEEGKIDGFSSAWSSSEDFVDSNGDGRYNTAEAFIIDVNGMGFPNKESILMQMVTGNMMKLKVLRI